jgi:hypothetical protein
MMMMMMMMMTMTMTMVTTNKKYLSSEANLTLDLTVVTMKISVVPGVTTCRLV